MSTTENGCPEENVASSTAVTSPGNCDPDERVGVSPAPAVDLVGRLAMAMYAWGQEIADEEAVRRRFSALPADRIAACRWHAHAMAQRLAAVRCAILPAPSPSPTVALSAPLVEAIACRGHAWLVDERRAEGWRAGYPRDRAGRVSPNLVQWDDLPEGSRRRVRRLVAELPGLLPTFGCSLVPHEWAGDSAPPTVRVGAVGLRHITDTELLRAAISGALSSILRESMPGSVISVSSPLAEGADQLIAELALKTPGAELTAVLPLPLDEYLATFDGEPGRARARGLLRRASRRPRLPEPTGGQTLLAFEQAGRWVVDDCDYLLAIWDGRSGGPGGTADAVAHARSKLESEGKRLLLVDPSIGVISREP